MHFLPKQNININNFPPQQSKVDWVHAPSSIQQHQHQHQLPPFTETFLSPSAALLLHPSLSNPELDYIQVEESGGEVQQFLLHSIYLHQCKEMRNTEKRSLNLRNGKNSECSLYINVSPIPISVQIGFYKGLSNIDIIIYF